MAMPWRRLRLAILACLNICAYACSSEKPALDRLASSLKQSEDSLSQIDVAASSRSSYRQQQASSSPLRTLAYLQEISGRNVVAGMHNRFNTTPDLFTDKILERTQKKPALWSGDFLFEAQEIANRPKMIEEAIRQWHEGSLINIMWHACNPALAEPCNWEEGQGPRSKLSDAQWQELLREDSELHRRWIAKLDEIAGYLRQLQDAGVEVLFRPLHEMNQGMFWWGGRPGPDGTRRLFEHMHYYFTEVKQLHNLVWVWDMQDFPSLQTDLEQYRPESRTWDIAALDVYDSFAPWKYEAMQTIAKGKPIAIGECDRLPDPAMLSAERFWSFFMSWSELTFESNSDEAIRSLYTHPRVVTQKQNLLAEQLTPGMPNKAYGSKIITTTRDAASVDAVVDGDPETAWKIGAERASWFVLDFGRKTDFERIRLNWGSDIAQPYEIAVSSDAKTWVNLYKSANNNDGGVENLQVGGSARYLKFLFVPVAKPTSLWEIEVY